MSSFSSEDVVLRTPYDLLLCKKCGTQYSVDATSNKEECKVCDDPRQYVLPTGQVFTTLGKLKDEGRKNVWWQLGQEGIEARVWSVKTYPEFAIGDRAILIQTDAGNILWDLIPFIDQQIVERIVELGGLEAIVISHPHYYSTWADWSRTFNCPVYVGKPDQNWLERVDTPGADVRFLTEHYSEILPGSGAQAVLTGGHFPGSLLLYWQGILFIADTIFTSPSAMNPFPGKNRVISFTFFWSIPNRIPLHLDDISNIWRLVMPLDFHTCLGAFKGMDVRTVENEAERGTGGVKGRLLESCKIYCRAMGWTKHAMLNEAI
ncbi:Putative metallo-beta-lactamase, ribonuclease Z/Hydroxyacylglutathione hydrolase [Septoria linicola]|uniref:Metallo-beta-lactamase, ribonuclease Z/Hydroxyacylglutathione hydrolase n=1 Tax=Septoria linicola TaxID=215465 RepID=A0A9Q9AS47_9PEZI|nr:putative metallo-beta-lactamase, ribonuclease Z/Hydroxyacylglutathione hydrolase [Septoria linicola]USW51042.1 Putative metallo-beta-lactamase, ribonuclease Z/Hydroxyacylglutathione hydrolase [Septoria linicola]